MPSLDARLEAALALIHAEVHADIGSDHAALPVELVRRGRVRRAVVVELTPGPLDVARQAVARAGLAGHIDVRAGNGFAPLAPGEVHSASITGMGARTILGILRRAGEEVPPALVLQPNDSAPLLRRWAGEAGFHVTAERLAAGFWNYAVLRFERRPGPDPAYTDLPLAAALEYGPHLLRAADPLLLAQVHADIAHLTPLAAPGRPTQDALETARTALSWLTDPENKKPALRGR
ncbi:tRNA (adenine22-N1)-methyltransferase [Deinococcus metalli]|uniref:tRNA (Adenine-N(1))-methyltransferase n=1 Tax=Deinococcus metalli TaxID=1141878 RepID=A0A7W8KHT1_9DEIO|nr:tRNA (adenine(22)-N(1))-methyltransferase TrmK [Deinococcus metalli]MBB5378432.1 tRNA (adenine22-N1)-methyltransferase [Deinococcus metalli]GHF59024.1 tRNA (adenine-N(1))-methyltransferase [Deinococcus metalli]